MDIFLSRNIVGENNTNNTKIFNTGSIHSTTYFIINDRKYFVLSRFVSGMIYTSISMKEKKLKKKKISFSSNRINNTGLQVIIYYSNILLSWIER